MTIMSIISQSKHQHLLSLHTVIVKADKTVMSKCFLVINSDELESRSKKAKNINTDKSEKRADTAFWKFLLALGKNEEDIEYWLYDKPTLDDCLAKFWFGTRKDICEDEIIDDNKNIEKFLLWIKQNPQEQGPPI